MWQTNIFLFSVFIVATFESISSNVWYEWIEFMYKNFFSSFIQSMRNVNVKRDIESFKEKQFHRQAVVTSVNEVIEFVSFHTFSFQFFLTNVANWTCEYEMSVELGLQGCDRMCYVKRTRTCFLYSSILSDTKDNEKKKWRRKIWNREKIKWHVLVNKRV